MAQWGRNKASVNVTPTSTVETTEGAPIGVWALVNKGGGPNAHFGNTSGTRARTDLDMYTSNDFSQFVNNMAIGVYGFTPGDTKLPGRVDDIVLNINIRGGLYDPRNGYEPRMNIVMANGFVNRTWAYGAVANSYYVFDVPGEVSTIFTGNSALEDVNEGAPIWADESPKRPVYANSTSIVRGNAASGTFGGFRFTNLGYAVAEFAAINDDVYYTVPFGETPIAPLTANTWYRVAAIENGDTIVIGTRRSSDKIRITDFRATVTAPAPTHFINGETFAFRVEFTPGAKIKSSHPGWNIRKEGTGGRKGRVQYECLVAMGTISNT